ncbi:MAG: T9SS type A sorting domain-containing protein, partial [Candidatus Edwardsbacteria bacterium]|nr:T9SS type A sorting domain-containing protein [Candidatus Edwardsbacteria bacterium]
AGNVRIAVYNVAGQKVKTLVDGTMNAGYHSVSWDGRNESGQAVSAGVYLYQMQADNFSTARKLVVVR